MAISSAIVLDNNRAHDYAMEYIVAVDGELFARALKLTSAMQKFAKFLDLPECDSKVGHICEVAFGVICVLQPEFALAPFLGKSSEAVGRALEGAKAESKLAKIAMKAKETGEKIKTVTELAGNVKEATSDEPRGISQLKNLDASRRPVAELIKSSRLAREVWRKGLDLIDTEFENRVNNPAQHPKESLAAMIARLLPLPKCLTDDELDEFEELYLWKMIGQYVQLNVVVRDPIRVQGGPLGRPSVDGLNDNQIETVLDLFGPEATRGKIFSSGPYRDAPLALVALGAKRLQNNVNIVIPRGPRY